MLTRMKWLGSGAVLAIIAVAGGSLLLQGNRRRAEVLRRENERLIQQRAELARKAERLARERELLLAVVERLNLERRSAGVEVLEQHRGDDDEVVQTVIRFTEIDRDGKPLAPQTFGVPGVVPHFDALVIKFENDAVARGDALRGRSLALFRRVYGETQAPEHGYWIGRRSAVPDIYRVSPAASQFEVNLWREFWSYATDPAKARRAGVRVAQGEAVYAPMKPGERWVLTLEADGGLNLIKQSGPTAEASTDDASASTAASDLERRLHVPSPISDDVPDQ